MTKLGAILLMGAPGAGKGTQAFLLMHHLPNFVHFDTGGEIYRRITDPAFADDPVVQEQKKIYFNNLINDPRWVAAIVSERIRFYSGEGRGVILSGSPRTLVEAQTILPLLEDCYGKERVLVVEIVVSPEAARARNLRRLVCSNRACRYPAKQDRGGTPCPNCGQLLPLRVLEDERWKIEGMDTRLKEFAEKTRPAIEFLKERVAYIQVDGEKSEEEVLAQILSAIKKKLRLNLI